jgi:hypothetical protein
VAKQGGAVRWLAGRQLPDGSFEEWSSPDIKSFKASRPHDAAFFTSLILIGLEKVPDCEPIIEKAGAFLKSQASPLGSWNYWRRDSPMVEKYPYPDDLDDSCCALLALSIHNPGYVDGAVLARLAKLLIACETKPGGPYRTWLVEPDLYGQWGEVDLVVNANIGSLLRRHGVKVAALESYADQKLSSGQLESSYYVGQLPVLYFLSRWYDGKQKANLKALVAKALRKPSSLSDLDLAMMITAACRLGFSRLELKNASKRLVERQKGNHWQAAALYYMDPALYGEECYAGSATLTTALALEALSRYEGLKDEDALPAPVPKLRAASIEQVEESAATLPANLRQAYIQTAVATIEHDTQAQIIGMAGLTAAAYGKKIPAVTIDHLNLASLNGWLAYDIYDDFFDQEATPANLAVANHAARQIVAHFYRALPKNAYFQYLVGQTLDTIDAANYWEVLNARGTIKDGRLSYKLPNYGRLDKLFERSWGHALAATGTLLAAGYAPDSREITGLHKFFRHFLIARQLNDDAHDWQDDLRRGQLSAVVVLLLKDRPSGLIDLEAEMPDLQLRFWQDTINETSGLIGKHITAARQALTGAGMVRTDIFAGWLDSLEAAARQAADGSQLAKDFIQTYQTPAKTLKND